ncbi:hypothetical protein, partial [Burkholderia contaminans]|uniref:hypothetical protein n=1 Tax=Burkholderia contaminans TaxID=488447 RepID=UPI001C2E8FC5
YVNLKIATCLVRYADDRLIDQRFPSEIPPNVLANIAECAAWFIYDESIEKQISIPLPARRDMVAAHLRERFPLYAAS